MTPLLAIVNPAAGGGRCGARAPAALDALRARGLHLDEVRTERPGDAIALARDAWSAGRRGFVAVGGDGTAWEIVNGLFPEALAADTRPVLGFLPLGTGNSFLRDFADDIEGHALRALERGLSRPCDVVRVRHAGGEMFFTNLLSVGFTADVGATVNDHLKPLGELGYGVGVLWEVARLVARPLPHGLDGGPIDSAPLVFVSFNNSRFTGGKMQMAPSARINDGLIDVIRAGDLGRLGLLRTFPAIFRGTHTRHPAVTATQARSVVFAFDRPVDVMVDGEVVEYHLQALDVLHAAIEVLA